MNRVLIRLRRELDKDVLFDQLVEVARNACVGGASIAAAAVAAAAYCDSPLVGIPALRDCMRRLKDIPLELPNWCEAFPATRDASGPDSQYAPGFGYITPRVAVRVRVACRRVLVEQRRIGQGQLSAFYLAHHRELLRNCGALNSLGLMALVFVDQDLQPDDAERYLVVWQLNRAIIEAQKARQIGAGQFPFLTEQYNYEGPWPARPHVSDRDYLREIGLIDEGAVQ